MHIFSNFIGYQRIVYLNFSYDTLWYVAPLPIQKLFLIMQKSIKSHKVILGGLFVACIEGFSTVTKILYNRNNNYDIYMIIMIYTYTHTYIYIYSTFKNFCE